MANIRIKRRLTGAAGAPASLLSGEPAYNKVDGILYIGDGSAVVPVGGAHYATAAALATETSNRTSAISSENARATAAESALGTRIDNVLSNVTQGSLDSLTEVVTAFQAADSNLNGAITSLANSASSALTAEVNRATAAEGVIAACHAVDLRLPLVVRMKGTNEDLGKQMLADSGLPIIPAESLAEAAERVVEAVQHGGAQPFGETPNGAKGARPREEPHEDGRG